MNPYEKCLKCYQPISHDYYHPQCARALFGKKSVPQLDIDQDDIETLAHQFINERLAVPGVQRKLSLQLISEPAQATQRLTIVGYLGGTHILKPPTDEYPFMPEIEHLTMHLAAICNIKTATHGLIAMKNRKLAYINLKIPDVTSQRTLAFFVKQEENMLEAIDLSILPAAIKSRFAELISARIKRIT